MLWARRFCTRLGTTLLKWRGFLKRWRRSQAAAGREFLASHPNPGNRVKAVEAEVRAFPQKQYTAGNANFGATSSRWQGCLRRGSRSSRSRLPFDSSRSRRARGERFRRKVFGWCCPPTGWRMGIVQGLRWSQVHGMGWFERARAGAGWLWRFDGAVPVPGGWEFAGGYARVVKFAAVKRSIVTGGQTTAGPSEWASGIDGRDARVVAIRRSGKQFAGDGAPGEWCDVPSVRRA